MYIYIYIYLYVYLNISGTRTLNQSEYQHSPIQTTTHLRVRQGVVASITLALYRYSRMLGGDGIGLSTFCARALAVGSVQEVSKAALHTRICLMHIDMAWIRLVNVSVVAGR